MKRLLILPIVVTGILILGGCARAPIKGVDQALRLSKESLTREDDLLLEGVSVGLEKTISELRRVPGKMRFGPRLIDRSEYALYLEALKAALDADVTGDGFWEALDRYFEVHEVFGDQNWGEVFITSYYEPVIPGSLTRTPEFSQALYRTPQDLKVINFAEYARVIPTYRNLYQLVVDDKSRDGTLRGRVRDREIVPYFSRDDIDRAGALKGQKQELVWVRPTDAFFLQIQGSGRVRLPGGQELVVGYADQNGHPYVPIGKFLLGKIPKEEMTMQKIEAALLNMTPTERQNLMSKNPSYVFFQELTTDPLTKFGVEVLPGRTIATDQKYFPKGGIGFLEFEKPIFTSSTEEKPSVWVKSRRLVFDHDVGGAIRGPHRVDLFWGRGDEAKQVSGVMRNPGRLVYFVPRANAMPTNASPQ